MHVLVRCDQGVTVYVEASRPDQSRGFRRAFGPVGQGDVDAFLDKERRFDPDLWVIEVEGSFPPAALPGGIVDD